MLLSIDISKFADIKTVISLVGLLFTVSLSYLAYKRKLQLKKSQILIAAAPLNKRAELIEQEIGKWGLSAKGLDADKQFELIKQLERQKERRFYFSILVSAMLLILAGVLIAKDFGKKGTDPVFRTVALMDSPLKDVVYNIEDYKVGRTNADAIYDIIKDIEGIEIIKETTSRKWKREDALKKLMPSLIIMHGSCFYDRTNMDSADYRFSGFMEEMANFKTARLLIYSRGFHHGAEAWLAKLEKDYPGLKGRVDVLAVAQDTDFNNDEVQASLKKMVKKILNI